jgi:chromosomal replication initiator protein
MEKHFHLKNILLSLIEEIKKQDFLVYFRKMSILEIGKDEIVFGTVSAFMKDNIEAKFMNQILLATQKEFGETITKISFKVDSNIDNPSNTDCVDCTTFYKSTLKQVKKDEKLSYMSVTMQQKKSVNDRYALNNFIVGADNQLAFSACEAVSRNPGKSYNPLYIY